MTPLDLSWRLDPTAILLLVLVVGIAAAVLPFAHRSLRGDRHGTGITLAIAGMLDPAYVPRIGGFDSSALEILFSWGVGDRLGLLTKVRHGQL